MFKKKNGSLRNFSEKPLIINGSLYFFPLVCGGDEGVVTTVLLDFFILYLIFETHYLKDRVSNL